MIDWHCHILPGFDDGPAQLEEALDMARVLAGYGFTELCCTPHCMRGSYEPMPLEVREAVGRLQLEVERAGIPVVLHPGMEYYLDEFFEGFAGNLQPLGRTRLVLCEAPQQAPAGLVAEAAALIVSQGYVPLVAHPERSDVIWRMIEDAACGPGEAAGAAPPPPRPSLFRRLFGGGRQDAAGSGGRAEPEFALLPDECLFQANLGSFTGFYGATAQRRAYDLLQRGGYHCFASDLHDLRSAPDILDASRDKLQHNPALRRLLAFEPPAESTGNRQMAFW